jgi:hypothetical protein
LGEGSVPAFFGALILFEYSFFVHPHTHEMCRDVHGPGAVALLGCLSRSRLRTTLEYGRLDGKRLATFFQALHCFSYFSYHLC